MAAVLVLIPCAAAGSGAGRVAPAGHMTTSRAAHTATLLRDGSVLIAGGMSPSSVASAEVYDPRAHQFAPTASMTVARAGHTATLLPDGRVLIVGGYNGEYLRSCEIYDPRARRFSPTGEMNTARSGHVAVSLGNGRVLVAGGVGLGWSFLRSAEIYDSRTAKFSPVGDMATERESHAAALLRDGRVLIAGGHKGRRAAITIYSTTELFDPVTGRFTPASPMRIPRHKHDAVVLADGRVLVSGGSDQRDGDGMYDSAEIYDPTAGVFRPLPAMTKRRFKHQGTSQLLADGNAVILGGADRPEFFDVNRQAFSAAGGSMGTVRLFSAASLLPNGDALITGGYDDRQSYSDAAWTWSRR